MVFKHLRKLAKLAWAGEITPRGNEISATSNERTPSPQKARTPETTKTPEAPRPLYRRRITLEQPGEIPPSRTSSLVVEPDDVFCFSTSAMDSPPASYNEYPRKVPESAEPALETHEPKSLMALPPELRLRIYEYVFDCRQFSPESHCCSIARLVSRESGKQLPMKCSCKSGPQHPQILGVCKTIFQEAMPIMYNNLELRVVLPPPGALIFQRTLLANHIPVVPGYAIKYIKKLVFVAARQGPGMEVDKCSKPYDQLKRFWPAIWTHFSSLDTVRLHFHFDEERYLQEVTEFDYESFKGLVRIRKLRRIAIEMHVQDKYLSHAWRIKTLTGMLSAYLRAEAQLLQRPIDVTIDLTWVHRTQDGTPWNFKI